MVKRYGSLVLLIFAMIIFFTLLPDVLTAVSTSLGWTSGGSTVADFTGAEITMKIMPLLIIGGFAFICGRSVWTQFGIGRAVRGRKAKGGGAGKGR
ncbi:hypothetical protein ES703_05145 [subsurface metagenome]